MKDKIIKVNMGKRGYLDALRETIKNSKLKCKFVIFFAAILYPKVHLFPPINISNFWEGK